MDLLSKIGELQELMGREAQRTPLCVSIARSHESDAQIVIFHNESLKWYFII